VVVDVVGKSICNCCAICVEVERVKTDVVAEVVVEVNNCVEVALTYV